MIYGRILNNNGAHDNWRVILAKRALGHDLAAKLIRYC